MSVSVPVNPDDYVIYENNSGSYAALYRNELLSYQGDPNEVLEEALRLLGVTIEYSDDFLPAPPGRECAKTINEIYEIQDRKEKARLRLKELDAEREMLKKEFRL